MKIGLYGVTKSGKSYLKDYLVNNLNNLQTINGSKTLQKLCKDKSWKWNYLTITQKTELRKEFIKYASKLEMDNIIIDGHYSFINNNQYEIAMNNEDIAFYDILLYLKTEPNVILERTLLHNKNFNNNLKPIYSLDRIAKWQEYEIKELQKICSDKNAELIVLDNDLNTIKEFISNLLNDGLQSNCEKIANHIINSNTIFKNNNKFIITDCDRTLSLKDYSYTIIKDLNINFEEIKNNFAGEYYSTYNFYKMAKLYDMQKRVRFVEACKTACKETSLCKWLVEDFKKQGIPVIAITSGNYTYWQYVLKKNNLNYTLIGGSSIQNSELIISKGVKEILIKTLISQGKTVYSFGDSMVDYGMMIHSNKSFILCNEKHNKNLEHLLLNNNSKNIYQFSKNKFTYKNIRQIKGIKEVI